MKSLVELQSASERWSSCCTAPHDPQRAIVELTRLEEERKEVAAATGGEAGGTNAEQDHELLSRISVVRDGIYRRLKLLGTWADLDDDVVRVHTWFSTVANAT